MDISKVTDVKELKSMAYDQLAMIEQGQANLRAINTRITEIVNTPPMEDKATTQDQTQEQDV